jgi:hypothetical protein
MPDLSTQTASNTAEQAAEVTVAACSCGADVLKTGFIVETTSTVYQAFEHVGGLLVKSYRKKSRVSRSIAKCTLCHAVVDVPAQLIGKAA